MVDCYLQELSNRPVGADDRATLSEIARWVTVGALFVCLILVYAWSHNEILGIRYQMEQLKKESDELLEINAALRAEYSSLINPESVERKALELGLIASNRAEVRILDSTRREVQSSEWILAQSNLQKKTLHE
jgi:cell division protein FtsL